MHKDLYQAVTDQIVAALEGGVAPWVRPWSREADPLPINVISDRAYRGVNVLLLNMRALFAGYSRNRWLTYRQAAELGGQVRKGETGVQIVYYKLLHGTAAQADEADKAAHRVVPLLRSYTVFNVGQVEGLQQAPVPTTSWEADAAAEELIGASGAVIRHGGCGAYYLPSEDRIQVPERASFPSASSYYATLLHELVHWSGHPTRCNRQLRNRFGDSDYAAEELIAEIGSAFLCAQCRIDGQLQHASYVDHWLRILRGDKRAIFTASTKAQQAADYLTAQHAAEQEAA